MTPNGRARVGRAGLVRRVPDAPAAPKSDPPERDAELAASRAAAAARAPRAARAARGRFRTLWFALHGAAACFALGLADRQRFVAMVAEVAEGLRGVCAKCHNAFEAERAAIEAAPPDAAEANVHALHARINAAEDDMYAAPPLAEIVELYRARARGAAAAYFAPR